MCLSQLIIDSLFSFGKCRQQVNLNYYAHAISEPKPRMLPRAVFRSQCTPG